MGPINSPFGWREVEHGVEAGPKFWQEKGEGANVFVACLGESL